MPTPAGQLPTISATNAGEYDDVACTVCGCVCDDLRVGVANGRIVRLENACNLAKPWFEAIDRHREPAGVARIDGQDVELSVAVERAATILADGRAPLIWGLSRSSTDGQRASVRLGDRIGATVDTTASVCHAPSITAIQSVGESASTLGEVRNRADLVVYWGANPVVTHPRHLERYAGEPRGSLLPRGRADRHIVVVDGEPHETVAVADQFVRIEPGRDLEAIWTLRQLVAGREPNQAATLGANFDDLRDLALRMKCCRYGVVFFGLGIARAHLGHLNVQGLLRLVAELNAHTRFTARRMRIPGDVTGADAVLCWQTGYPFAVDLGRGYPRHEAAEFSADARLARGEVDACLLVGSEAVPLLSAAARAYLAEIPVIVLDHAHQRSAVGATVSFTTAVEGVHVPATIYRMDGVPIRARPFLPTTLPTDAAVLNRIMERLPPPRP